ncbi:MAG: enoyl-CoA hydratase/isomerase family protein, partial [Dehalococcoidales bacterium]|nr:enoyl-CoA hydratase/isomerase family protein [Dehalococcoidales bacterium]
KKNYEQASLEIVGDHIVIVSFDNPPVNAGVWANVYSLDDIYAGIREDDDIRCSIITGNDTPYKGKHYFCGGADIKEWSGSDTGATQESGPVRPMVFPRHAFECESSYLASKPSIAMVNGAAIGYGADWVLMSDLAIASDDATIGWVYILRGIAPYEGGTWMLPQIVGMRKAMELLTMGTIIDAEEGYRLNIFNKVVPHNQLRDTALEWAKWYAEKGPPLALGVTRTLIREGLNMSFHQHLQMVEMANSIVGPDRKEAMAAWVEKREPKFEYKGAPGK